MYKLNIASFFIFIFLLNTTIYAQTDIEELRSEMSYVESGELSLLVLDRKGARRFFIEKQGVLLELTPESYKDQINELTSDHDLNTLKLKFQLKSLGRVIKEYNNKKSNEPPALEVGARLGAWGGLSNFVNFPSIQEGNENNLFLGVELEAYGKNKYDRHAVVLQLRKSFPGEEVDLDLTELMIGYRFNALNFSGFMFYFELEFINFSYYDLAYTEQNSDDSVELIQDTGRFDLDTPLGLGAGVAIRLFKGSYFTLGYSNMLRLSSTRDDFPIDIRAGLKFNL